MNKSKRINVDINSGNDQNIILKLEQDINTLDILSLNINQKDTYQFFNSDYGVLVGRVLANGGLGVENVRISIFIPISEEDKNRGDITALYPYTKPTDKDSTGKRYNLLPRVSKKNDNGIFKPKQPFGSIPIREEIISNDTLLEVYEKYYKYTTITNSSGDYMLFGVPVGIQTVHMSVDITDIGEYSMTPSTMVSSLGYSSNLFNEEGNAIKESDDLDDLPNIETQEVSVDVIPYWGDLENYEIGITRQDFRIRAQILPSFIFFGTSFSDGDNHMWSQDKGGDAKQWMLYRARDADGVGQNSYSIANKRVGELSENIYYYPPSITDNELNSNNFVPERDSILMNNSQYSKFFRNGDFIYVVPCNRKKIITSEFGNPIEVDSTNPNGVFTEFAGFMTFSIENTILPMNFSESLGNNLDIEPIRYKYKIPQSAELGSPFTSDDSNGDTILWKQQFARFQSNKIYSLSKFQGTVFNSESNRADLNELYFLNKDERNDINRDANNTVGVIAVSNNYLPNNNSDFDFPSNIDNGDLFGAQWINFCLHFNQVGAITGESRDTINDFHTNTHFTSSPNSRFFLDPNSQIIGGNIPNTQFFARNDINKIDIIEVPIEDLLKISEELKNRKGFTSEDISLSGTYKNGGTINGNPSNGIDPNFYFFKGLGDADCINYLFDLDIL